jgi:hypothetical protein
MDAIPDMAVQFESGHTHEFFHIGPEIALLPGGQ